MLKIEIFYQYIMVFRRYRKSAHKTNPLNRGFKERVIRDDLAAFLQSEHNIVIVANKKIEGGSSRRRPDVLIGCGEWCIIVEVDERQHRSYSNYSNDINDQRVADLINDLQGLKLVLIRFNPDSYKDSNRVTRRSLFSKSRGDRIYQIGCPNQYKARMNLLKQLVEHYLVHEPSNCFVEHKLYYDKFDPMANIV